MTPLVTKLFKLFFLGCFIVIFAVGAVLSLPKFRQVSDLNARKADILRQIDDKRQEIKFLREQRERFDRDRDFVESLARQDRRVFPNEIVFAFDD